MRSSLARRAPRLPQLDTDSLISTDVLIGGEIDLYQSTLTGDHSSGVGGGEVTQSVITDADLSRTRFDPLALVDVRIHHCDLAGAVWEGMTARRVEITDCRAVGWRTIVDFAEDMVIEGCRFEHGGMHLNRSRGGVVFRGCTFAGTALRGDMSGVVFDNCDLAGAEFSATAARGCDLRTSRLDGARGLPSLSGAVLSATQVLEIADLLATELGFHIDR